MMPVGVWHHQSDIIFKFWISFPILKIHSILILFFLNTPKLIPGYLMLLPQRSLILSSIHYQQSFWVFH